MSETKKVPIESFKDFLGQEVKVGDHVVYATVSGRSPVQKYAEVVGIYSKQETRRRWFRDPDGGNSHWGTETVATVQVGVRELSNGRGFTRWDRRVYDSSKPVGERYVKDAKPARVTYPMHRNIVKVRSADEVI